MTKTINYRLNSKRQSARYLLPALRGSECGAASSHCPPVAGTWRLRHRLCWGWRPRRDCRIRRSPWPPVLRSDPVCSPERWGSSSRNSAPTKGASTHLEWKEDGDGGKWFNYFLKPVLQVLLHSQAEPVSLQRPKQNCITSIKHREGQTQTSILKSHE